MTEPIHLIGWASQPDIQFVCDESWSQPIWGDAEDEEEEVYLSDDDPPRRYTFDEEKVTCLACKAKRGT